MRHITGDMGNTFSCRALNSITVELKEGLCCKPLCVLSVSACKRPLPMTHTCDVLCRDALYWYVSAWFLIAWSMLLCGCCSGTLARKRLAARPWVRGAVSRAALSYPLLGGLQFHAQSCCPCRYHTRGLLAPGPFTNIWCLAQGPHYESDVTEIPHEGAVDLVVGAQSGLVDSSELYKMDLPGMPMEVCWWWAHVQRHSVQRCSIPSRRSSSCLLCPLPSPRSQTLYDS
jgi:hypothetical protein